MSDVCVCVWVGGGGGLLQITDRQTDSVVYFSHAHGCIIHRSCASEAVLTPTGNMGGWDEYSVGLAQIQ